MKKFLSTLLVLAMLFGCFPLSAFADEAAPANTVSEIAYSGAEFAFVQADGTSTFGMLSPQEGSTFELDGDKIVIHIVPSNLTVYKGFYYGDITAHDPEAVPDLDVAFNEDGTFDFTVSKDKCGKGLPIVPVKKKDGGTTKTQYYLGIPAEEKIPVKEAPKAKEFAFDGDAVNFIDIDGKQFGMFTPQEGTKAEIDGENVVIHYIPKNTTVYGALYFGDITDELKRDITFNADGTFDITLSKDKCGYAWPAAPIKNADGATTKSQYYLAIPAEAKLPVKENEPDPQPEPDPVTEVKEFAYAESALTFIKADGSAFGMWAAQDGTTFEKDGDTIIVHFVPKNKTVYAGFLYGAKELADGTEKTLDVAANEDGTLDFTVSKDKCGYAWPVAPVKKADHKGTSDQMYLAIPAEDKIPEKTVEPETFAIKFVNEDGTELQTVTVTAGEMPAYTGETPVKAEDDTYTYTFKGWDPELAAATADATYKAIFDKTEKSASGGGGGTTPAAPAADSTVDLKVTNEVRMFKVTDAKLVTKDGTTNLVVTLSGTSYLYLFKGNYDEAVAVGNKPAKWIEYKEDKDGKYYFEIPVTEDETYIPVVSISQKYVDGANKGENKISRAFFPRQMTLDAKKKTLLVEDYEYTQRLKVKNKTDLDVSSASLTTVGGPNSNEYGSTLKLTMKSDTYTKAYIGSAKRAASAKDTVAVGSGDTFSLKVRWVKTMGDPDSVESYIGEETTFAFYNASTKKWEEFTLDINEKKAELTILADEDAEPVAAEETPADGTAAPAASAFIDVKDGDWFNKYANNAAEKGLMAGYAAGKDKDGKDQFEFRGNQPVTRAMFVTILNAMNTKLKGEAPVSPSAGFEDVQNGIWYEKAVDWAYANGVAAGRGKTFGVDDNVSRQDMAVFMYAYAKKIGKAEGTPDRTVLDKFADAGQIADYAKDAMAWLVSSGLMAGRSETSIAPLAQSSRAEISAFAVSCFDFLSK